MLHVIWTILIGFVAGLIAKAVTPGAVPSGFFLYPQGHAAGFIASIIGAIVLLVGYRLVTRNSGK
jgi:uncharacterized membrane protein YeaQ/YmgE (transglycosylase-associated protein family)